MAEVRISRTLLTDRGANTNRPQPRFQRMKTSRPYSRRRRQRRTSKSIASCGIPIGIGVLKSGSSSHIGEMEEGLKTISAELAASTRRKKELEGLVERLQTEIENRRGQDNRTSDYFSEPGTSTLMNGGDTNTTTEHLERLQRKTDRELAHIRLDCQEKVQEQRARRSGMEKKIDQLKEKESHVDLVTVNSLDNGGRMKGLETTCADLRWRLNDDRNVKDSFQELLTALSSELHMSHNECDNLRDEGFPQLRARVKELEAQAAEHEKLAYEYTKMQQQMKSSRNDDVYKLPTDTQQHIDSLGEDGSHYLNLSQRSNSDSNPTHSATLLRSRTALKSLDKEVDSREMLLERLKDAEAQRDALHCALKSLFERKVHQIGGTT